MQNDVAAGTRNNLAQARGLASRDLIDMSFETWLLQEDDTLVVAGCTAMFGQARGVAVAPSDRRVWTVAIVLFECWPVMIVL